MWTPAAGHDNAHQRAESILEISEGIEAALKRPYLKFDFLHRIAIAERLNHLHQPEGQWAVWLIFRIQGTVTALLEVEVDPNGC
jgi:hypothetical protein